MHVHIEQDSQIHYTLKTPQCNQLPQHPQELTGLADSILAVVPGASSAQWLLNQPVRVWAPVDLWQARKTCPGVSFSVWVTRH